MDRCLRAGIDAVKDGFVASVVKVARQALAQCIQQLAPPDAAIPLIGIAVTILFVGASTEYREVAAERRKLANLSRFPGSRQDLLELATRLERKADHFDS